MDDKPNLEELAAERERKLRMRAYQIWIDEEKPVGRALDHWLRAKRELGIDPSDTMQGDHDFGPE
jgi:hypothetical protein